MTVYYKMRQILLQNTTAILLQKATELYYKLRQVFYYKSDSLFQNVTVITKCDAFTTKCDSQLSIIIIIYTLFKVDLHITLQ